MYEYTCEQINAHASHEVLIIDFVCKPADPASTHARAGVEWRAKYVGMSVK